MRCMSFVNTARCGAIPKRTWSSPSGTHRTPLCARLSQSRWCDIDCLFAHINFHFYSSVPLRFISSKTINVMRFFLVVVPRSCSSFAYEKRRLHYYIRDLLFSAAHANFSHFNFHNNPMANSRTRRKRERENRQLARTQECKFRSQPTYIIYYAALEWSSYQPDYATYI